MQVTLNRNANVPLHEQLAEQILFQIGTGKLAKGQQLPSVRALAQRLKIHHNTVSKAYASLVRDGWLSRRRGALLHVVGGAPPGDGGMDELIDQAIWRAQAKGFSIKELEARVIERLSFAPPRYVLVVEEEAGLQRILKEEIEGAAGFPVRMCTPKQLAECPGLAADAYLVAFETVMPQLDSKRLKVRSSAPLVFSSAEEHFDAVRRLNEPSSIGVASYSPRLLQGARALLLPTLGEQHSYHDFLFPMNGKPDFRAMDLIFCDSLTMKEVVCRKKLHYRLVAPEFLEQVAEWFFEPRVVGQRVQRAWKVARKR